MSGHDEGGSGAVSLPVSRAFVVQFSADTLASANCFAGRVEHIEWDGVAVSPRSMSWWHS